MTNTAAPPATHSIFFSLMLAFGIGIIAPSHAQSTLDTLPLSGLHVSARHLIPFMKIFPENVRTDSLLGNRERNDWYLHTITYQRKLWQSDWGNFYTGWMVGLGQINNLSLISRELSAHYNCLFMILPGLYATSVWRKHHQFEGSLQLVVPFGLWAQMDRSWTWVNPVVFHTNPIRIPNIISDEKLLLDVMMVEFAYLYHFRGGPLFMRWSFSPRNGMGLGVGYRFAGKPSD